MARSKKPSARAVGGKELSARVQPLSGALPAIAFKWDPETEILSGHFSGAGEGGGLTGSVEIAGTDGAYVVLDVNRGVLTGLEIAVWPKTTVVPELRPPRASSTGKLSVPSRPSQPGIAAVELETSLAAEKSEDQSVIHLMVGPKRSVTVVQLADNLLLEVDEAGQIAGFWLLDVPPLLQPGESAP
ncbi:hypothetical protein HRbin33_00370 [bacterium HR33]|nr:hypothetical protein HRbin33_00370 [bacterium HR33]